MNILKDKTITDVPYFKASGVHVGIRKNVNKKDLCVIFSEKSAVAAGVFTKNIVKAAPVLLDMEHIKSDTTRAIVVNSGCANACTGEKGYNDALEMAKVCGHKLNIPYNEVLVSSTGVIGTELDMSKIIPGIDMACNSLSYQGGFDAAEAIMTTDTFIKSITVETEIGGRRVLLSGIAKGSGMIHPNMGTMLSYLVTDVAISKSMLTKALKATIEDSFNMVSIDGDTSTNDSVIILANGAAENKIISEENEDYLVFKESLDFVCTNLSKQIAKDGEGATKLIEAYVSGASTKASAKILAKAIITSSLVKTAIFGSDANWGRILCALGYSGVNFSPEKVDIYFKSADNSIQVVKDGRGLSFDEEKATLLLNNDAINITVVLRDGTFDATAWGCDLTYDYVKINGSYRS